MTKTSTSRRDPSASRSGLAPLGSVKAASTRKSLNLSVRADLVEEARATGTNISAVLEAALDAHLRQRRAERWREENAAAIDEANAELARNGLWSDGLRLF